MQHIKTLQLYQDALDYEMKNSSVPPTLALNSGTLVLN